MTDNKKVLTWLQGGMSLTCLTAIKHGITHNLRSRVSNLKDAGHDIQSQMIEVTRADGKTARVKEYWL